MSFSKSVLLLLLALLPLLTRAQQRPAPKPATPPKGQRIELLPGAGELLGGTFNGVEIRKVLGNVSFRQGTTLLYCDSAYQYTDRNALEAFSNVRIIQNDTVTITGNHATYDGDTRKARITGNVVMRDPRMTLTTDVLDYDLNSSLAYYSTGGHLVDPENTLDSQFGYYNTTSKIFSFRRNVHVVTKSNEINSDTLQYNTVSKVTYFFGPTRIKDKLQRTLYAENGTYNTITKLADFQRNAKIETPEYLLGGDKLIYDQNLDYGVATGHVSMTSKKDNLVIRGDVGRYWRALGRAKVYGGIPVMRNISGADTLYMAADTLVSVEGQQPRTASGKLQTGKAARVKPAANRPAPAAGSENEMGVLYAYRRVKIFRGNMQGRCDSLTYDRQDSIIYMNRNPILWSDKNQLTADSIEMRQRKSKIDQVRLYANAFAVSQDTLLDFNQAKGRRMIAYFSENKLKKVDVAGNAESIYYALEGDSVVSGLNKAVSANMTIRFLAGKLNSISLITNPDASFIPPHEVKPEDEKLKGMVWRAKERPTRREVLGKHFAAPAKAKPKSKAKPKTKPVPVRSKKAVPAAPVAVPPPAAQPASRR